VAGGYFSGQRVPRVLVVGKLGYHERNITQPIIAALSDLGADVERVGGCLDFFVPESFDEVRLSVSLAAAVDASRWDVVFCVDWWNFAVPSLAWTAARSGTPLVGLCHGSVRMDGDVARDVPGSLDYEAYLLSVFSEVYTHALWVSDCVRESERHDSLCRLNPLPHPYSEQIARRRPDRAPSRVVLYAHRWAPDKGNGRFVEFVRELRRQDVPCRCIVTDEAAAKDERLHGLGVDVMPRLSQDLLRDLCHNVGGYAWSSARSEIAAYAVHDLISYGLHPLVCNHPAYFHLPATLRWMNVLEAVNMVEQCYAMSNETWAMITAGWKDNARNIAEAILSWVR